MIQLNNINRSIAIQRAKNYKGAKAGLQVSLAWAIGQALNGNADGLYMIMLNAQMLVGKGSEMFSCADGRQVWKYWSTPTEQGGLGLKGILTWDREKIKFKMGKNWQTIASNIDLAKLVENLNETRWDLFAKTKADRAFDLDKAIVRLIKQAGNNGILPEDVVAAVAKAAAA